MRLTSFIVGAIVGVSAAMYMNNSSKRMASSFSQAGDSINRMVGTARSKMMNTSNENKQQATEDVDLEQVEHMINEDPHIKEQVDQILNSNNNGSFPTQ